MPFFKDIWQNVTRPDKPNEFMTQFAQQLMMGGGSKGPLARMGNKLIGGLLHGGQRGAAQRQQTGNTAALKNMMGAMRGGVSERPGVKAQPGMGVLSAGAMDTFPDAVPPMLAGRGGTSQIPGSGILAPGAMSEQPLDIDQQYQDQMLDIIQPDPWGAIAIGLEASEGSSARKLAESELMNRMQAGDEILQSPTGEMWGWDGKDIGSMTLLRGPKDKGPDVQKVGNNLVQVMPDGTTQVVYQGTPDQDIYMDKNDTTSIDENGHKWTTTTVTARDKNTGQPVWSKQHPARMTTSNTVEGAIESKDSLYQRERRRLADDLEIIQERTQAVSNMWNDQTYGPVVQESLSIPGKALQMLRMGKDYLNKLPEGSQERAEYQAVTKFARQVHENVNLYIKNITGAQMSEAEATRLMQAIYNSKDGPAMFEAKLQGFTEATKKIRDVYLTQLERAGGTVEAMERAEKIAAAEMDALKAEYGISGPGGPPEIGAGGFGVPPGAPRS